ncbi:MAG: ATP synthase subunit I [SAR324 cluster bacterium]|nr:ATP synthase subunit I [SAR324 cluster bacterium]
MDPIEKKRVLRLNRSLWLVFVSLSGGSYAFMGIDFAKGTLIGCGVVAINFFISQRLIGKLMLEKKLQAGLLLSYFFKLTLSIVILFLAVTRLKVDLIGLMLGLSSIFCAVVLSTMIKRDPAAESSD